MSPFHWNIFAGAFSTAALLCTPVLAATTCDVASMRAAAPADTTIVSAQHEPGPIPNCTVDGYVTTTNPGPNKDNFRLQLPDRSYWQERYYFIGEGGSAGYVPTDSQIPGGNPMVMGFAVAGTDTGHQAPGLDWSFLSDPAKAIDHTWRGAHVVAVATQQLTRAYYAVDRFYRYESGCSGGGRMGGEAIMRNPQDYDGVMIAGGAYINRADPNPPPGSLRRGFVSIIAEMTREPGSWLSPAKLAFADEMVTRKCGFHDGVQDDVVWDHRKCSFDFSTLKCKSGDKPDCLTQPEITSINNLLRDSGMPISNMSDWSMFIGSVPPPWNPSPDPANMARTSAAYVIETTWARTYLNEPERDIVKNPLTDAELEKMREVQGATGFNQPVNPDLTGIEAAGTKVIFWNGVSDPCCSNVSVENAYTDLAKSRGGDLGRVAQFARLYEFPGMGHCSGGTGPDDGPDVVLRTLVDWVEHGKPPGPIVVHRGLERAQLAFISTERMKAGQAIPGIGVTMPHSSGVPRDFLICPFPETSVFDTSKAGVPGAVYDAANWSCRAPPT